MGKHPIYNEDQNGGHSEPPMRVTFEEMGKRSREGVEERAGRRMPEEKFQKVIGALEGIGEEISNRDERLGILKGLQHAARWAEAGEALDDLVAAGWDVDLRHRPQGWSVSLAADLVTEETTARVASGWHGKAAGAIFEAADLAAEALRPVPEVNGHDHFGIEGEERR